MIPVLLAASLVAQPAGPPAPVVERRETVTLRWDAMGKACVPTVRGVETGDVATERGRETLAAAVPDRGATLVLLGAGSLPYDCVIGVIDTLKHAGHYGRIVTGAEPPPR